MSPARGWMLNGIAAGNATLGLAGLLIVLRYLGVGTQADIWLLAQAMIGTLSLLAQGGVEQFPVFYAEAIAEAEAAARGFLRSCLRWALLLGSALALIAAMAARSLVWLYSPGLDQGSQHEAAQVFVALTPLIAVTPLLYILRQTLSMQQRYLSAMLVAAVSPALQLAVLLGLGLGLRLPLVYLAGATSLGMLLATGGLLLLLRPWLGKAAPVSLRGFIVNSLQMRAAHSLHNLLYSIVINNALSRLGAGAISQFQYARRLSDGLSSVTVGPAAGVYHARQTHSWVAVDAPAFAANLSAYARAFLGPFALAFAAAWLMLAQLPKLDARIDAAALRGIGSLFVILAAWQLMIGIETVAVGVLNMSKRVLPLLLVNMLFIVALFVLCRTLLAASALQIALALISAQLLSTLLFVLIARSGYRQHYGARTP